MLQSEYMASKNDNDSDAIEGVEDWLNEHGQPNVEYLNALAANGTPEAIEKLRFIAEDLDVDFNTETSAEGLVEHIRMAMEDSEDSGADFTQ
jgi:hypothetical protein